MLTPHETILSGTFDCVRVICNKFFPRTLEGGSEGEVTVEIGSGRRYWLFGGLGR